MSKGDRGAREEVCQEKGSDLGGVPGEGVVGDRAVGVVGQVAVDRGQGGQRGDVQALTVPVARGRGARARHVLTHRQRASERER